MMNATRDKRNQFVAQQLRERIIGKKESRIKMPKCNSMLFAVASVALMMINSNAWLTMSQAQSVKGGSLSSLNAISNSQQFQQIPQTTGGNQLSSSFVQMFNSLTPSEQQQFIKQMSSSNRKIFQQAFQPQTSSFFNEEVSSSSGGSSPFITGGSSFSSSSGQVGGTKSGSSFSKQVSSNQILSPIQQQAFFKQQKVSSQSFAQPTIQPSSAFSFSRQVSSSAAQPQQIILPQTQSNEANFQSTKTIIAQPQPQQQQSYFNQIQRVQQVAQPVVLPTSEQTFRRVQSFSSQPLPVQQEAQSGFTSQQFVQQIRPQPTKTSSSSFNRQFRQQAVVPQPIVNNQFSSVSSSSNLAGSSPFGGSATGFDQSLGGFSQNLQQEKVDFSQPSVSGGQFESQNQFVQTQNGFVPITTGSSSFEQQSSQSSGFDSSDVQQKNVPASFIGDDVGGGLTAASINNKWYIMKPVENPSALGLGDARAASGSLRQVSLSRALSAQQKAAAGELSSRSASSAPVSTNSSATSASSLPKKRSAASEVEKAKDKEQPVAESSSLLEPDEANESDETEERRRR